MIHQLPYETLLQVYRDSVRYSLDQDFIELLEREIRRREDLETKSLEQSGKQDAAYGRT